MAIAPPSGKQAAQHTDPRILRSRRMLVDALASLLRRKPFDEISVQEIADEATLNRATFYLHYTDKNALLQAMAASRFQKLVDKRGLSFDGCHGAVQAIALGVCDYLAESPGCPGALAKLSLEESVIPVIVDIFRDGAGARVAAPGVDAELVFTTAAWAIYGAAKRWLAMPEQVTAEEMAASIERMIMPIFIQASLPADLPKSADPAKQPA